MKIEIAFRLKPYSHTPGMACLIPGTETKIEAYPTFLKIGAKEFDLPVTGPVRNFTIEQDLEKNCVWVFGKANEGFYRLKISAHEQGFEIFVDKAPKGGFIAKEKMQIGENISFFLPPVCERLSLGINKDLDWDFVWRRMDLLEILPVIFCLGQKVPPASAKPLKEMGSLLEKDLESFCKVAFRQMLVPQGKDLQHLGLVSRANGEEDPFSLLQAATKHIRALFFRQSGNRIHLLPANTFPSGRLIHIQATGIGEIDMEWTKGILRRVCLRAKQSCEIIIDLQKGVESYRIRTSQNEKGKRRGANDSLQIVAGKTYYLDKFQK